MITGYNSEVRHGNRVFHVQTEDKGLGNPRIETLIYLGGEILDSYRGSYEDLVANPPVADQAIQARMDDQHKTVIRDIKNGKYDFTPGEVPPAQHPAFSERPLDQAILEYLAREGEVDTLELVLDEPLRPTFGTPFTFTVQARLCVSRAPVAGAEMTVKLISSYRKAGILASGQTDNEGRFTATVDLPPSQPGHCAVVIACASESGSDELRTLITAAG